MTAFFCSRSTFRAITRLQTLATQAKIEETLSLLGHVILVDRVTHEWMKAMKVMNEYRKIPKISPGAYISQRPFSKDLFLEGLIYGGKFAFQNRLG